VVEDVRGRDRSAGGDVLRPTASVEVHAHPSTTPARAGDVGDGRVADGEAGLDGGVLVDLPPAVIVVGASPRAERYDRPVAYRLAGLLDEACSKSGMSAKHTVLVCTDVWYLNDDSLSGVPVVSVGGFAANALSAWMRDKLETIAGEDGWYAVQADDRDRPTRAVVWGINPEGTARAAEVFAEQLLEQFLHAVTR